jgi:serine O-acetyltransferase
MTKKLTGNSFADFSIENICEYCEHDIDDKQIDEAMNEIARTIMSDYDLGRDIDNMKAFEQPDQDVVIDIVRKLMMVLFPGYYKDNIYRIRNVQTLLEVLIEDVMYNLRKQIQIVLLYDEKYEHTRKAVRKRAAQKICLEFFKTIPTIREYLNTDLEASFDGDPAAFNKDEIVLCYPGLYAIAIYRIAHELYRLGVPLLPRMMTEYGHRETGVDIHPGATIGKYFFIDHATGIVVGSTSEIGEHVKIYQGVTIGALSTKEGHKLHGTKRHPTLEDNVTVYSGASILGGDTVIGEGSVIGGNAFITSAVAPNSRVGVTTREVSISEDEDDHDGWKDFIEKDLSEYAYL